MMAAAQRLVHSLYHPIRRGRAFRDRTNPLDKYNDIKLFQRVRFPRCELLEVLDNFKDDVTFKHPHMVHGAGNVASGVQGIGDICPHFGFLLICHSTRGF